MMNNYLFSLSMACLTASALCLPAAAIESTKEQLTQLSQLTAASETPTKISTAEIAIKLQSLLKSFTFAPSPDLGEELRAVEGISCYLFSELSKIEFEPESQTWMSVQNTIRLDLQLLDAAIVENYVEQLQSANVMPPEGTENTFSGMDPATIKDPKLRQKYLALINDESNKGLKNLQQRALNGVRHTIFLNIIYFQPAMGTQRLSKERVIDFFTYDGPSRRLLQKMDFPKP